jgi:serine O-acetyltransferase
MPASFLKVIAALKEDIDRYVITNNKSWLFVLFNNQGLWVTIQYRFSHWVHYHVHLPIIRPLLKFVCAVWKKLIEIITGCNFPSQAEIGIGLYIAHPIGINIYRDAKIGNYCNLSQHITIGIGGRGKNRGTPTIGDRVFIGPGACLFGPIIVGNDVAIGANAVVTHNLPNNAVAVGVPAKVISYQSSKDYILYREYYH